MLTSRRTVVCGALAAALLTAACSSSTSGTGSTAAATSGPTGFPSSSSAPATSPGSTTPITPASSVPPTTSSTPPPSSGSGKLTRASLTHVVVQAGDLPAGWTGKKSSGEDASDKKFDKMLAKCVGGAALGDDNDLLNVSGDDYGLGMSEISSDATSYRSQSDVDRQVTELHSPRINGCLNKAFRTQFATDGSLPQGVKLSSLSIKISDAPAGGPKNLVGVANGAITITGQGQSLKIYLYIAFITGRLLTSNVSAFNYGQPLDAALIGSVVTAVAGRAASV